MRSDSLKTPLKERRTVHFTLYSEQGTPLCRCSTLVEARGKRDELEDILKGFDGSKVEVRRVEIVTREFKDC